MNTTDWIGSVGVTILLVAFLMNLLGKISKNGVQYLFLNTIGAGLACLASVLLKYWPFIILEGVWTLISLFGLAKVVTRRR